MIEVEGGGITPLYSGCWWYALFICSLTEFILHMIEVGGEGILLYILDVGGMLF